MESLFFRMSLIMKDTFFPREKFEGTNAIKTVSDLAKFLQITDLDTVNDKICKGKNIDSAWVALKRDPTKKELSIAKSIASANDRSIHIISFFRIIEWEKLVLLEMEFVLGLNLLEIIQRRNNTPLSETVIKAIAIQIKDGLKFCHRNKVIHRDVKLENIMVSPGGIVKIIDFGLSCTVTSSSSCCQMKKRDCGTPGYISPQIIFAVSYPGCSTDVWGFGATLFAMAFAQFAYTTDQKSLRKKFTIETWPPVTFPSHTDKSPLFQNLISQMLVAKYEKRIHFPDLDKHPWFGQ